MSIRGRYAPVTANTVYSNLEKIVAYNISVAGDAFKTVRQMFDIIMNNMPPRRQNQLHTGSAQGNGSSREARDATPIEYLGSYCHSQSLEISIMVITERDVVSSRFHAPLTVCLSVCRSEIKLKGGELRSDFFKRRTQLNA